jgi:acetyltransferase-like isoleucine patch superfamily enzyme
MQNLPNARPAATARPARGIGHRAFAALNRISPVLARSIRRLITCSVTRRIDGRDNRITYGSAILRGVRFEISGSDNLIEIGDDGFLQNVIFYIRGDHHRIVIGRGCRFERGGNIWFEDDHGELTIGRESSFEDVHLAITEPHSSITIGDDCMFAYDIDLRTGDSHSIIDPHSGARINPARNIAIGNHVWVAAHCVVLKGVSIADHSVVGTGSVVTKSSPEPGVVLAGNPARVVKQGISWSRAKNPARANG